MEGSQWMKLDSTARTYKTQQERIKPFDVDCIGSNILQKVWLILNYLFCGYVVI